MYTIALTVSDIKQKFYYSGDNLYFIACCDNYVILFNFWVDFYNLSYCTCDVCV